MGIPYSWRALTFILIVLYGTAGERTSITIHDDDEGYQQRPRPETYLTKILSSDSPSPHSPSASDDTPSSYPANPFLRPRDTQCAGSTSNFTLCNPINVIFCNCCLPNDTYIPPCPQCKYFIAGICCNETYNTTCCNVQIDHEYVFCPGCNATVGNHTTQCCNVTISGEYLPCPSCNYTVGGVYTPCCEFTLPNGTCCNTTVDGHWIPCDDCPSHVRLGHDGPCCNITVDGNYFPCDRHCNITVNDTYISCDDCFYYINSECCDALYFDKCCQPPDQPPDPTRLGSLVMPECPACNYTYKGQFHPCTTECIPCLAGFYSDGTGTCSSCTPGFCSDRALCSPCTPGTFVNHEAATSCLSCDPSSYQKNYGMSYCKACNQGMQGNRARTDCVPCNQGQCSIFNSTFGCQACLPGTYSLGAACVGSMEGSCEPCPPGTYNSHLAQPACSPCGAGFYNPNRGSVTENDCIKCPSGSYCPDSAMGEPSVCPKNSFCDSGARSPSKCKTLYVSESGKSKCTPGPWLYVIIVVSVSLFCVIGTLAILRFRASRRQYEELEKTRKFQSQIPEPMSGPVYSGF